VADEKENKVVKKTAEKKATTAAKKPAAKKTNASKKETTAAAKKTATKATTKTATKATAKKADAEKVEKASTKTTETKAATTKKAAANTKTAKAEVKTEKATSKAKVETTANDEAVAKATVKYARISSRKVKIVADLIRGKNVDEALAILQFTPKAGTEVLTKLLNSAIANAENNHNMTHSKLYVAEIYSNQGPTLKRIRPAAKGSAVRIRKRTSHTTIVLKERD